VPGKAEAAAISVPRPAKVGSSPHHPSETSPSSTVPTELLSFQALSSILQRCPSPDLSVPTLSSGPYIRGVYKHLLQILDDVHQFPLPHLKTQVFSLQPTHHWLHQGGVVTALVNLEAISRPRTCNSCCRSCHRMSATFFSARTQCLRLRPPSPRFPGVQ
jgi:hypothetical protein